MSFRRINVCVFKRKLWTTIGDKSSSEELMVVIQIRSNDGSNQGISSRGGKK